MWISTRKCHCYPNEMSVSNKWIKAWLRNENRQNCVLLCYDCYCVYTICLTFRIYNKIDGGKGKTVYCVIVYLHRWWWCWLDFSWNTFCELFLTHFGTLTARTLWKSVFIWTFPNIYAETFAEKQKGNTLWVIHVFQT